VEHAVRVLSVPLELVAKRHRYHWRGRVGAYCVPEASEGPVELLSPWREVLSFNFQPESSARARQCGPDRLGGGDGPAQVRGRQLAEREIDYP
jgi:hypothetical protein